MFLWTYILSSQVKHSPLPHKAVRSHENPSFQLVSLPRADPDWLVAGQPHRLRQATRLWDPHWASIHPTGPLLLPLTLGWAMASATPLLQGSQVLTRPLEIRFGRLLGQHSLAEGKIIPEGGRSKSCAIPQPTHHIVFLQQSYSRAFLWCQTTQARRAKTTTTKSPVCSFPRALARHSLKSYTCKKI